MLIASQNEKRQVAGLVVSRRNASNLRLWKTLTWTCLLEFSDRGGIHNGTATASHRPLLEVTSIVYTESTR